MRAISARRIIAVADADSVAAAARGLRQATLLHHERFGFLGVGVSIGVPFVPYSYRDSKALFFVRQKMTLQPEDRMRIWLIC